jgi:hypothetical protein
MTLTLMFRNYHHHEGDMEKGHLNLTTRPKLPTGMKTHIPLLTLKLAVGGNEDRHNQKARTIVVWLLELFLRMTSFCVVALPHGEWLCCGVHNKLTIQTYM